MSRPKLPARPRFVERMRRQAEVQAIAWIGGQRARWVTRGALVGLVAGFVLALLLRVLGR